jgi:hypothetical protein
MELPGAAGLLGVAGSPPLPALEPPEELSPGNGKLFAAPGAAGENGGGVPAGIPQLGNVSTLPFSSVKVQLPWVVCAMAALPAARSEPNASPSASHLTSDSVALLRDCPLKRSPGRLSSH